MHIASTNAVEPPCFLQPVELSPRDGLGGRAGDDRLRPATLRIRRRAQDLAKALVDLALLYPEYRIPECVGGYARGDSPVPGAYPRANTPQLWNASAFPLIVQTLLGLVPLAATRTLVLDPALPAWMPDVIVRDLRVGDARVSLRFLRNADATSTWEVLDQQGSLHILRQPPPESLSASWSERAGDVLESIFR